jgi:hypothetical protein
MGTPMQNQASAVLNALDEGKIIGMYDGIKATCPGASNGWIIAKMRSVSCLSQEDFDYWIDWFQLDKRK